MKLNLDGVYLPSFNKNLNITQISVKTKFNIIGSAHSVDEIRIKEKTKILQRRQKEIRISFVSTNRFLEGVKNI